MKKRPLTDIMNNEALDFALYTLHHRALPSMIDGCKPVHRFVLYSTLKDAKSEFAKVAALGSNVAKLGYNHGEVSAQDALKLMAAEWTNNLPLVAGRGNFGSRMIQDSAAARYVYAKMHPNFPKYFKDIELSPEHPDPEHVPPAFYVPVIPVVLVNGMLGIATGYSTKIYPHDLDWVKKAVTEHLAGKEISEPVVSWPCFDGEITYDGTKYTQHGTFDVSGLTAVVTEIPTTYDHPKYCAVLDKLVDEGKISSWTDETSDTFQFRVRFKRGSNMTDDFIKKTLKLTKSFTPNVNVINQHNRLASYDDVRDLVKDFVDFRLEFLEDRISNGLKTSLRRSSLADAKVHFIKSVIAGETILHGKTKAVLTKELSIQDNLKPYVSELLAMTVDKMTSDEVKRLEKEANDARKEHEYWQKTTPKKEYVKDIKEIQ
ncbi:DNA topoisomerase II [Vibrio phage D479]